jgi:hypothetical protein
LPKFVEADRATAAGLVDDPYLDTKCLLKASLEPARLLIGSAARRVGNDERDGFVRVFRVGGAKGECHECGCDGTKNSATSEIQFFHQFFLPLFKFYSQSR